MILNLTQHVATPEQRDAGVIDLPDHQRGGLLACLTVHELPTITDILARAEHIAEIACHNGLGGDDGDDPHPAHALIGGAPWMMRALEDALVERGIQPVYAFSVRASEEQIMPDGSVRKINVFRHAGFVGCLA